jgi:tetratricopeptide (TPR) repeat protein
MTADKASDTPLNEAEALPQSDAYAEVLRLRALLQEDPLNAGAYRLLGQAMAAANSSAGTAIQSVTVSGADVRLREAAQALQADDLETAEIILRARLLDRPHDVNALRLLAALANQLGFHEESEALLRLTLELEPSFAEARTELARQLNLVHRYDEALAQIGQVLERSPENDAALALKATVLANAGRFDETVDAYQQLVGRSPGHARSWAGYGRALKTVGRTADAVAAFRKAAQVDPACGEAWWSLSDLKTVRFEKRDIAMMSAALERGDLTEQDRYYLHFALGKAFDDQRDAQASFTHYAEGNRLRRERLGHDPGRFTRYVDQARSTFTAEFFRKRDGWGHAAADPIFIVGMTRAGSTLIEQILSSHPAIEGTMELPHLLAIARNLSEEFEGRVPAIAALERDRAAELGEQYLRDTKPFRKTDRPLFIDKMPNNWLYVGLIRLILPNARIIDARRHPLACGWSNFKQNYGHGQGFSYDLEHLGKYYCDYVRLMAHFDAVLPGTIHRVIHENLIDNPEREIRRMLDHLELPFDPACLRFHENARAVRTASAEQVRRPISREGAEQWRNFESWLQPLKAALGPVLELYPDAPSFKD